MKNTELEQLINEKLNSAAISDYAPNGLQVEGKETVQAQPIALVSEKEYEYGAEAFEAYMEKSNWEIKPDMKEVDVQNNDKARWTLDE